MNKEILINDLKRILETKPDEIINGTGFYSFSSNEIKGIIEVLEVKQ